MHKKTIPVDFDGVLNSYKSGWQAADVIPDPPVDGAIEWLEAMAADARFATCIYSSRSKEGMPAISAMERWLLDNGMRQALVDNITFPTEKPAAFLTVDDRCFHFQGQFPSPDFIFAFQPWTKVGDAGLRDELEEEPDTLGVMLSSVTNDEDYRRGWSDAVDHCIRVLEQRYLLPKVR